MSIVTKWGLFNLFFIFSLFFAFSFKTNSRYWISCLFIWLFLALQRAQQEVTQDAGAQILRLYRFTSARRRKSPAATISACVSAEALLTTRGSSCLVWWPRWTLSASWHPPQTTAVGHLSRHTRPHHRGHLHRGQPVGQDQIPIPEVHVEQPTHLTFYRLKSTVHLWGPFFFTHLERSKLISYFLQWDTVKKKKTFYSGKLAK